MKMKIRSVRLRIRYKRRSDLAALVTLTLLALVLVAAACLGTLAWGQKDAAADAQASPAAFAGMRKYYLTHQWQFDGNEALTACAPGYHMASLWEILDPSNLVYNTDLGATNDDSGAGPPVGPAIVGGEGWVRTGWDSEASSGIHGQDNCSAWTTADDHTDGTTANLSDVWTAGMGDMHAWEVDDLPCIVNERVWCVEDTSYSVHLPLVLKD